ncbi:hypothetical protein EHQ92_04330 [Leptospira biflexa]|jgi:hypothetical protein|uniref:hypothetical protein n=1 Tax=Leptospira biflexa TaxID=172 RepID=UPI0010845305|nr:hypothetical protein [Leptospira biflexa]TGM37623.1 hypothetical protein EHQ80_08505 [Leptospira biflexa]TGM40959.1 hypothetical protein EHQ89_03070 [Leptospira biflexa]TGM47163.1 hypothetical protein EHQ92_04330 [Leptospira biflexa]TGM50372.1 hypothetical protein EHQ88_08755 [Leptospira biflexa]
MQKKLYFLIFSLCILSSLSAQESKYKTLTTVSSGEELNLFMSYYYTYPNLELVPKALSYIQIQKINANKEMERHIVPFFAQIFKTNDDKIPKWFEDLTDLSDDDQYIFAHALFLSGGSNAKKEIQKFLDSTDNEELKQVFTKLTSARQPIDLRTIPLTKPVYLDMIWSSFFATGDVSYLEKLILATELNKKSVDQILIYSAARWSLKAVAKDHKKVFDFCVSKKGKYSKDINTFLEDFET